MIALAVGVIGMVSGIYALGIFAMIGGNVALVSGVITLLNIHNLKGLQGKEKEEAIKVQEFEKAAEFRDKEHKLKEKLESEKKKWENL